MTLERTTVFARVRINVRICVVQRTESDTVDRGGLNVSTYLQNQNNRVK